MTAKFPRQAGLFTRVMGLLVDDGGVRRVDLRVMGRVQKASGGSSVMAGGR